MVEFKTENMRDKFSKCADFLLYETKKDKIHNDEIDIKGARCIFAKGRIKKPVEYHAGGKFFPFEVKGVVEKHITDHHQGLSIQEIKEFVKNFNPRNCDGLYSISKKQFDSLSEKLNTR